MPRPASLSSDDPTDAATRLDIHLASRGPLGLETPDVGLTGILRGLNGLDLIRIVEQAGAQQGSPNLAPLYRMWLDLHGGDADAVFAVWYKLGLHYGAQGNADAQVVAYRGALAVKPDLYDAALSLGRYYEAAGRPDLALAFWQNALPPDAARIALLNHSGRVLESLNRLDEAEAKYTASLLAAPDQPEVLHHWIGLRTRMCAWPIYAPGLPGVTLAAMRAATQALTMLALSDDPAFQASANQSWIAAHLPPAPEHLTERRSYGHQKLRIGYLSSDFCKHPIAYLIAELFELHDRDRFEIYGFCATEDDGSDVRRRILRAFDTVVDIGAMSDAQAARAIRRHDIDILIDLNGLTLGNRLGVVRWRPAPIQMTYLGYNGPLNLPELDYIIADAFVIPRDMAATYQPEPLYVPGCYQVNDRMLPIAAPPSREMAGLPADPFVFCCFSNTYKVTEGLFDAWMEILRRTGDSVLWLYVDNPHAMANLRTSAQASGVADHRLVFAGRLGPADYRGRLALADLFLDTYPYNAGTTASDALRVGLPLITISGRCFSARMAGSLLTALGAEDGIVSDLPAYIELAVALATDRTRYRSLRDRVTPDRWRQTIGDTPRFCRDLEAAFARVVATLAAPDGL